MLTTTVFVMKALHHADPADEALKKAKKYVERCQNFGDGKDGGFFFSPSHPNRNKAGDFRSYGSASADGVRALIQAGTSPSSARVQAGRKWLPEDDPLAATPLAIEALQADSQALTQ